MKKQINEMTKQKSLSKQETRFLKVTDKYTERKLGNNMMRLSNTLRGLHKRLRKLKEGGEREPELLHVLRKEIKKGMICMDLGANIGYITLLMAEKAGPSGKVYAIEPDPEDIEWLNANVKLNNYGDRVKVISIAISNKRGKMPFYLGKASNLSNLTKTKNTRGKPIMVNVDTLTNFCGKHGIPELIKMDIEGHEVEVMEGLYKLVKSKRFPCKIIMELHPIYYSSKRNLEHWMKKYLKCGFKTKYVISAGVIQPDLFKKWGYEPIETFASGRGLYNNFSEEHMLIACCHVNKQLMPRGRYSPKIARYVMVER